MSLGICNRLKLELNNNRYYYVIIFINIWENSNKIETKILTILALERLRQEDPRGSMNIILVDLEQSKTERSANLAV